MTRFTKSFTVGLDGFQDLVCCFGPYEGLGVLIVDFGVLFDGRFQGLGAAVRSPTYLVVGDGGEPSFNKIEP